MNLAMRADDEDYFNAEFVRTYKHSNFPGYELLKRLEERCGKCSKKTVFKERIIPCVDEKVRQERLLVGHFCDFYGYRPNLDKLLYLSPWEFCMYWEVKRYDKDVNRYNLQVPDQVPYPDSPGLEALSSVWYLQKRFCLAVPAPMRTKVPRRDRDGGEEAARLYCVYMRPWTLVPEHASYHVPLIEDLDYVPNRRLRGKQPEQPRTFLAAWKWYIDGNIVSKHQKKLIEQFMSICDCASSERDVDLPEDIADQVPIKKQAWDLKDLHAVFECAEPRKPAKRKFDHVSASVQDALEIGAALWNPSRLPWEETLQGDGHIPENPAMPTRRKRRPKQALDGSASQFYPGFNVLDVARWFDSLKEQLIQLNSEQLLYLRKVARRLQTEAMEDFQNTPQGLRSEPRRITLVAGPGTGKSQCIKWTAKLFGDVLGWEMGVQYQVLAAQNSMAALVGGATIHSWGCIPMLQDGNQSTGENEDVTKMFLHCSRLRWLIVDEISCAALRVLGLLERNCRRALVRNPWSLDAQQNPRLYGGLNVIFVGDYKQLPPVAERALFANPFSTGLNLSGPEKRLSDALWGLSPETFPDEPGSCMVLHRQHRTDDPWQQHVLSELRAGKETWETYCFTHGLPTQHVGTWLPGQAFVGCGNQMCQAGEACRVLKRVIIVYLQ